MSIDLIDAVMDDIQPANDNQNNEDLIPSSLGPQMEA